MRKENNETYPLYGEDIITAIGKKIAGWGSERFNEWDFFARYNRPTANVIKGVIGTELFISSYFAGAYITHQHPVLGAYALGSLAVALFTAGIIAISIRDNYQAFPDYFKTR